MNDLLSTIESNQNNSSSSFLKNINTHNVRKRYLLIPAFLSTIVSLQGANLTSYFSLNSLNSDYFYNAESNLYETVEEDFVLKMPTKKTIKVKFKKKVIKKLQCVPVEHENRFIDG
jgi:hypothetical protein